VRLANVMGLRNNIGPHIRPLLRKLGAVRFREQIAVPGWRAVKNLALFCVFPLLAVAAAVWALLLQGVAFPGAGSSVDQISATVYVAKLPAQVNLQSKFTPSAPTNNLSFTVKVTGPTKAPDPWLLIIQCTPPPSSKPERAIPLVSESLAGTQPIGKVLVRSKSTRHSKTFNFTCLTGLTVRGQTAATVVQNQDLNLSLPVLEQNPFAQSGLVDAPLYAEKIAGNYQDVVEVQALSAAPCPTPTPSPNATSLSSGSSSPSADTRSPSPAGTSSPSVAATTSTPATARSSPSASATSSAAAGACYSLYSPGATPVQYSFPSPTTGSTVVTSEILNNVTLSDERIDSIYPPGAIASNQVTWQGGVDLSPSLIATNLSSATRQNKDAFWAGLLYGVAAALAIPYFVEFYREWREVRRKMNNESPQGNT
jgi:hypothetical protein